MLDFPYLYMSFVAFYPGVLVYNGFLVFDVSNINSPLLIYQTWNLEPIPWYTWFTGHAKSCYIADTLFFLCSGRAGFDVYNITDPAAPNLVLTQNTPYSCDAIQVFNDTILVMDGLSLEVYRLVGTGIEETAVAHDRIGAVVIESYPDPFRNHMSIKYDLRNLSNRFEPILCFMNIYDVSGRLVKSIGNLTEHSGQITWYGKDDAGRDLPQGVYFVRLDAGDESYVRKVVMLR
jgi:hypothetical protein